MEIRPPNDPIPVLSSLLDEPLLVIDVGARGGFSPRWTRFGDRCRLIGFETDAAECERLADLYRGEPSVRLVPVALGDERGMATLYVTGEPACSSLYPMAERAITAHPGLEAGRVVSTTLVETTTLDRWCAAEEVHGVDVIELTTEGSELDVLRGASRTLDSVVAVEAAVQFNELREGVPLFGDVDAFLRQRGFLLWRLRDMAHYAHRGAATGWRSAEISHYDDVESRHAAGAGQLCRANACFLREAVVLGDPSWSWRDLVRAACVTAGLHCFDVTSLLVERARTMVSEPIAAALEMALADEARTVQARGEADPVGPALEGSLLVEPAAPATPGGGWLPAETLGRHRVCWTGPGRDAWVDVPVTVPAGTRVEVLVTASLDEGAADPVTVALNGLEVPLTASRHRDGILLIGAVTDGYRSPRPYTRVMIRTERTVPWNRAHPGSSDSGERGVAVAWLRLTAPEGVEAAAGGR